MSLLAIFLRFLRFGCLAWGGPVAQIGMLREELVEEERWVEPERFNRVLGVYQALPGPEAHELCVYFGTLKRGRLGGLLAGLGFMLPGVLFVLGAAWLYVEHGIDGRLAAAMAGVQVAAAALVLRAVHRIGGHALHGRWLWAIAAAVFAVSMAGSGVLDRDGDAGTVRSAPNAGEAALPQVAVSGLAAGSLSFGGAYTSVGFVRDDAVADHGWVSDPQFLDALALSGSLPAPLIVFATFVGYLAGGLPAALVMTAAIFLPAFAITLVGHRTLERIVDEPRVHRVLDAVTAAVVGLIAATAVVLALAAVRNVAMAALLAAAVVVLVRWKARLAILAVVLGCGLATLIADLLA